MSAKRRPLAVGFLLAATAGLGWTAGAGHAVKATTDPSSVTSHDRSVAPDLVVAEGLGSPIRALSTERSSPRLPLELLVAVDVAGIAACLYWTRRANSDRWAHDALLQLRRAVALRAPPALHHV